MDTVDALGTIRGRVADDLTLLYEALAAARKGKTHIVVDHLERVTDSLSQVLEKTKHVTD